MSGADGALHVTVMLDYCSSSLWDGEGLPVYGEDLAISTGLAERIEAWGAAFDAWDAEHNGDSGSPAYVRPGFPLDRFNAEGAAIAAALREELPRWTIEHVPLRRRTR